jgi:hypothetical protein
MPFKDVWLNDLSSKPFVSEIMQALKAAPEALALLPEALGASEAAPVPGALAQLANVRAAAHTSAPARVRVFFTNASWAEEFTGFLGAARATDTRSVADFVAQPP